jgi:transposase
MSKQYTHDFKKKIAELRQSGKTISELVREYGLGKSTISNWHKQYRTSGSFRIADNLSEEDKELRQLRKDNKQLRMEVDILKQAALIMGRKVE